MNWMQEHLGSMGHLGDFYIPQFGGGAGNGDGKKIHIAGTEQIQTTDKDWKPEIIRNNQKYQRIQKFYEWEQFLNWVDWSGKEYRRSSHKVSDQKYNSARTWTFQDAMNLARYGWAEGVSKIQQFEKLDLPIQETFMQNYDIQTEYSVAGGSVNIGRYLSGMPDCMRHMRTSNHHALPSRVQKIMIIGNSSYCASADEILKHGYKIYQIIEALEMANLQTDITLAYSAKNYHTEQISDYCFYETYIKIKKAEDVLYPEKILFCVAHPAMYRRLVVSENERNSFAIRMKYRFYADGAPGYGIYDPNWRPPIDMMKDALLITSLEDKVGFSWSMEGFRHLIKSQYEKIR